jgi:hypothetical protein
MPIMHEPIILTAEDPRLQTIAFRPYRSTVLRRAEPFRPASEEPQEMAVNTPWGETILAEPGDYIVSEIDRPEERWPVDRETFEKSYLEVEPGIFAKRSLVDLAPLVDLTGGDPHQMVTIQTMEGDVTVRAGDFYLARGMLGELWPYSKEKADSTLVPLE